MIKIKKFIGKDDKVAFAIDTNKYRFWITGWKIERFPIHYITDVFRFELPEHSKLFWDADTKVLDLKHFWKGFQPMLSPKKVQMLINKIELLEEDIEAVHLFLDDLGISRVKDDKYMSIVGRIKMLVKSDSQI